jgi:ADP-ribose pyrophosphatase YjhB (NUDIX family)
MIIRQGIVGMIDKIKVYAYIIHADQLLVFSHTDHPEAGIQIPGGTVEENESLDGAILREVHEESGLCSLVIRQYLGPSTYNCVEKHEIHHRHYYHLECIDASEIRPSWRHGERSESAMTDIDRPYGMIRFDFYWIGLARAKQILDHGHDGFLDKLSTEIDIRAEKKDL